MSALTSFLPFFMQVVLDNWEVMKGTWGTHGIKRRCGNVHRGLISIRCLVQKPQETMNKGQMFWSMECFTPSLFTFSRCNLFLFLKLQYQSSDQKRIDFCCHCGRFFCCYCGQVPCFMQVLQASYVKCTLNNSVALAVMGTVPHLSSGNILVGLNMGIYRRQYHSRQWTNAY